MACQSVSSSRALVAYTSASVRPFLLSASSLVLSASSFVVAPHSRDWFAGSFPSSARLRPQLVISHSVNPRGPRMGSAPHPSGAPHFRAPRAPPCAPRAPPCTPRAPRAAVFQPTYGSQRQMSTYQEQLTLPVLTLPSQWAATPPHDRHAITTESLPVRRACIRVGLLNTSRPRSTAGSIKGSMARAWRSVTQSPPMVRGRSVLRATRCYWCTTHHVMLFVGTRMWAETQSRAVRGEWKEALGEREDARGERGSQATPRGAPPP